MAKLIVLADFGPSARSNIWKSATRGSSRRFSNLPAPPTLSGIISSLLIAKQENHRKESFCISSGLPHTGLSFSWISLAQNLICSNPIYLRNKLLGLPCLTLLCFALLAIGAPPLLPAASTHDRVAPCALHRQTVPQISGRSRVLRLVYSIVYKICRYTWVIARHRGPMHHGSANRPTSSCTGYAVVSCSQTGSLRIAACPNRVCLEDAPSFSPQCEAKSCVRVVTNSNPRWLCRTNMCPTRAIPIAFWLPLLMRLVVFHHRHC